MGYKNLRKWLTMGAVLVGSLFSPLTSKAHQDMIQIYNSVNNGVEGRSDDLQIAHHGSSSVKEGYSTPSDVDYVFPAPWAGEWAPKAVTKVENHELERDIRPTNSVSKFEADLRVIVQDSTSINGTTRLGIKSYANEVGYTMYDFFDTKRHYPAEYKIFSNFRTNGVEFVEKKNLRDLCINADTVYFWDGPTDFAVNTTTNGEFTTGKYTQFCDWNKLVSSKTGSGTNSFEGSEILDYGTNRTVTLNANPGNRVARYVVGRTDNVGDFSLSTNDLPGEVTSTNVPIDNIKGSNSLFAVYEPVTRTLTINSRDGTRVTTNNYGSALEETLVSPVDVSDGVKAVANGGTVEGNDYSQNSSTNISIGSLTNNATLNWNWNTNYLFNSEASGNGNISGDTNGWYEAGKNMSVTANANEGSYFKRWSGDTNSNNKTLEFNLDNPISTTAEFKANPKISNADNKNSVTLYFDNLDSGQDYDIQECTNLLTGSWNKIDGFTASTSSTNRTFEPSRESGGLYRLKFTPSSN